jgi:hypothetical protein
MRCTKLIVLSVALLLVLAACSSSVRAAIAVDGKLSDWGISLNSQQQLVYDAGYGYSGNPTQSIEKSGQTTYGGRTILYNLANSNNKAAANCSADQPRVGQGHDAETMVVSVVGSNLYIGISTAQRPNGGAGNFAPGDICIKKGAEVWGIEVGGASYAGASTIVAGDRGTSYGLTPQGVTTSLTRQFNQKAGSIWEGGSWTDGSNCAGDLGTQLNTGGKDGGTYLGMSDYVYNFDSAFGQHAFIELCIPNYATLLGDDLAGADIGWSRVYGNEQLRLCVTLPPSQDPTGSVPEPASIAIWAVLLLTAACFTGKRLSPFGRR